MSKCYSWAITNKIFTGITQHFVIQYKVMITVKEDQSFVWGRLYLECLILANVDNCLNQMLSKCCALKNYNALHDEIVKNHSYLYEGKYEQILPNSFTSEVKYHTK